MIKFNNKTIASVYLGEKAIEKIYKGTLLVYEGLKKLIASGVPPLTLLKSGGKDLVDYKLYGESVQPTQPTPDARVEVESVGDRTKNLCNFVADNMLDYRSDWANYTIENGKVIVTNKTLAGVIIPVEPNKTYSFGYKTIIKNSYVAFRLLEYETVYDGFSGGGYKQTINKQYNEGGLCWDTITTSETTNFVVLAFYLTTGGSAEIYDFMANEGSTLLDYEPYGYKIPVIARGKNILNIDDLLNAPSGEMNGFAFTNILTLQVKPNTKYTMSSDVYGSLNGTSDANRCLYFHGTSTENVVFKDKPVTITTSDAGALKIALMGNRSAATPIKNKEAYIQIEEGDMATEYAPYTELRTEILLKEPLRKFKDYADYIDFENKKVVRQISERVLTGNENSAKHESGCYIFYLSGYIYNGNTNGGDAGYTNYFTNEGSYGTVLRNERNGFFFSTSQLRIGYPEKTTKAEFINWVKEKYNEGKPLKVTGILKTPTEETIELPNIPTIKGTCVLEVDTTIQPSNMEVVYKGKI